MKLILFLFVSLISIPSFSSSCPGLKQFEGSYKLRVYQEQMLTFKVNGCELTIKSEFKGNESEFTVIVDGQKHYEGKSYYKASIKDNKITIKTDVYDENGKLLLSTYQSYKNYLKAGFISYYFRDLITNKSDDYQYVPVVVDNISRNEKFIKTIERGDLEAVKKMINEGQLDFNYVKKDSTWTPLKTAVNNNFYEIAKLLLSNENVDANKGAWPPLFNAAFQNNISMFKLLANHKKVNIHRRHGDIGRELNVVHAAAIHACIKCLPILDERRVNLGLADLESGTPLYTAVRNRRYYFAKELMKYENININGATVKGWRAIHLATRNSQSAMTKLLLEHKNIDLTVKTNGGWTPLMLASRYDSIGSLSALLNSGKNIDINAQDDKGWTALMLALRYNEDAATLLLNRSDIDVNESGNDLSPLYLCEKYSSNKLCKILKERGARR